MLWSALILIVLGGGAVAGGLAAALRTPTWFERRDVDAARLPQDKRDLTAFVDGVSAGLVGRRAETRVRVEAGQLNRWLAARSELPEMMQFDALPLEFPQVHFRDNGEITFAGEAELRGGWRAVVAFDLLPRLHDDAIELEVVGASVGALPLPADAIRDALRSAASGRPDVQVTDRGLRLPRRGVWPNGRQPYRLESVVVGQGAIELVLQPLSR